MATGLLNARLWLGGFDVSGHASAVQLEQAAALLDDTVLMQSAVSRAGGLPGAKLHAEGYWDTAADADTGLFPQLGLTNVPVSVASQGGAEGTVGYTFLAAIGSYAPGGTIGDLLRFAVDGESAGTAIARGLVGMNRTMAATATGPALPLGVLGTGQSLSVGVHCLALTGTTPSVVLTVESDDNSGFTTPVTRLTFGALTLPGSDFKALVGPVATETYWRVKATITGTGVSAQLVAVLGIH